MEKFDQRVVYANHVRIYRQIERICEVSSDIPKLCAIRKPAFGKGDRKFMTLLPSFNGKEIRTGKEIPRSRDYLITGVKLLASRDLNFFLFRKAWALLNIRSD